MSDPSDFGRIIWNFGCLGVDPKRANIMIIFGCHNLRLAERAAQLYNQGFAPRILVSGGWGAITRSIWLMPEARMFQTRLVELGVPANSILLEEQASTVRENILFSQQIMQAHDINPSHILCVTQPFAERRVLSACQKAWNQAEITVTSPQIAFEDYPNEFITYSDLLSLLAGEIQRLQLFIDQCWIVPLIIPEEVLEASNILFSLGYKKYSNLSLYRPENLK
jgi:uncharacterized SAM-binding protein YcdF (DUF218 family)